MKVGESSILAIESVITHAYEDAGPLALGYFVLHIGGCQYGVRSPDATLLGCSFGRIERILAFRGRHTAPFADEPDSARIADAFRDAIFAPDQEHASFFGIPQSSFCDLVYSNELQWAPDGDEAFDDSSYVLQFDIGNRVRLIAFKCGESYHHDPITLRDVWLSADEFYGLLDQWHVSFEAEWKAAPKE